MCYVYLSYAKFYGNPTNSYVADSVTVYGRTDGRLPHGRPFPYFVKLLQMSLIVPDVAHRTCRLFLKSMKVRIFELFLAIIKTPV